MTFEKKDGGGIYIRVSIVRDDIVFMKWPTKASLADIVELAEWAKEQLATIRVHDCKEVSEDRNGTRSRVLEVSYSTDVDDDMVERLPMKRIEVEEGDCYGPEWDVDNDKMTDFQKRIWEAVGDAACAEAERRTEDGY